LASEVGAECGGNGVGEGEWRDVVEQGARIALSSHQAFECGWGGVACHDRFSGPVGVCVENGADVCSGHVASISWVVHDFM
jgi:hypothetical protein